MLSYLLLTLASSPQGPTVEQAEAYLQKVAVSEFSVSCTHDRWEIINGDLEDLPSEWQHVRNHWPERSPDCDFISRCRLGWSRGRLAASIEDNRFKTSDRVFDVYWDGSAMFFYHPATGEAQVSPKPLSPIKAWPQEFMGMSVVYPIAGWVRKASDESSLKAAESDGVLMLGLSHPLLPVGPGVPPLRIELLFSLLGGNVVLQETRYVVLEEDRPNVVDRFVATDWIATQAGLLPSRGFNEFRPPSITSSTETSALLRQYMTITFSESSTITGRTVLANARSATRFMDATGLLASLKGCEDLLVGDLARLASNAKIELPRQAIKPQETKNANYSNESDLPGKITTWPQVADIKPLFSDLGFLNDKDLGQQYCAQSSVFMLLRAAAIPVSLGEVFSELPHPKTDFREVVAYLKKKGAHVVVHECSGAKTEEWSKPFLIVPPNSNDKRVSPRHMMIALPDAQDDSLHIWAGPGKSGETSIGTFEGGLVVLQEGDSAKLAEKNSTYKMFLLIAAAVIAAAFLVLLRRKHTVSAPLLGCILGLVAISSGGCGSGVRKGPKLALIDRAARVADLPFGTVRAVTFPVGNSGDVPLEVKVRSSGCSCLTSLTSDFTVAPGEVYSLVLSAKAIRAGESTQAVVLETNDSERKRAEIRVSIHSGPPLYTEPAAVSVTAQVGEVVRGVFQLIVVRADNAESALTWDDNADEHVKLVLANQRRIPGEGNTPSRSVYDFAVAVTGGESGCRTVTYRLRDNIAKGSAATVDVSILVTTASATGESEER